MTDKIAFLWWENEVKWEGSDQPFNKDWKSKDYATYVELFDDKNIEMYVAEYRWLNKDNLEKAWFWDGGEWRKKTNVQVDLVYDLFRHNKKKMKLKKKLQEHVTLINDPEVADLCQDKLKTYREFPDHVPETKKADKENIQSLLDKYGEVVLKPRYGSSGEGIERIKSVKEFDNQEDMLVQRFVSKPQLPEFDINKFHDLRIIIINGEIVGGYLRLPKGDEFLSNVAKGASVKYLEKDKIPESAFPIIENVSKYFQQYSPVIYTVDFIFEEGKPSIMELNSQPGIYYHQDATRKEYEYPWMKKVVKALENAL